MSFLVSRSVKATVLCMAGLFCVMSSKAFADGVCDTTKLFAATGSITKHDNNTARWVFDFKQSGKAKGEELKWSKCILPKAFQTSTNKKFSELPVHKYSISVSNQFFGCELKTMCNKISATNPKLKTIYIVDLCQEPHLFLDGIPVSYRTPRNRHVIGLNDAGRVKMKEEELSKTIKSGMLVGCVEKISSGECSKSSGICESDKIYKLLKAPVIQREEEVATNYCVPDKDIKVVYKRFPITDHSPALFEQLEKYLDFLKTVDFENSHLHLHCKGGKGRTLSFLSITQKYLFPETSMEQILKQQYDSFGKSNLIHKKAKGTWKDCLASKRYNALKCLDKLSIDSSGKEKRFIGMSEVQKCWNAQYNNDASDASWQGC